MFVMGMTSVSGTEAAELQERAARNESPQDEAEALARANAIAEKFYLWARSTFRKGAER